MVPCPIRKKNDLVIYFDGLCGRHARVLSATALEQEILVYRLLFSCRLVCILISNVGCLLFLGPRLV